MTEDCNRGILSLGSNDDDGGENDDSEMTAIIGAKGVIMCANECETQMTNYVSEGRHLNVSSFIRSSSSIIYSFIQSCCRPFAYLLASFGYFHFLLPCV